jgi:hypothetical protein
MGDRLTGDEWAKALHRFQTSAFRWEAQGTYREPYEQEPLRQFLTGADPDTAFLQGWLDDVRRATDAGRRYSRVRVLTDPLTDYLRFELSLTPLNAAAGEDIRVLPAARQRALAVPDTDFWLFDDEWAAVMHFGDTGFLYADAVTEPTRVAEFLEIRERVWQDAVPFEEYAVT